MSFAFGFSGDDIDVSGESQDADRDGIPPTKPGNATATTVSNASHPIDSWLSKLPSSISYSTIKITYPIGRDLYIPRRELFDVRAQLIAEDDEATLRDLETSDLRTNVYEGGFKTWECSIDLASLLLGRETSSDSKVSDHVIELGAGSALPTLVLFHHAIRHNQSITFTLADFNSDVLRLVTLPNLLLTWARMARPAEMSVETGAGELDITPELVSDFSANLSRCGIQIHLLSGPWSSTILDLIPLSDAHHGTLVLAAETIYSPASTIEFVDLITRILGRTSGAKAIVAAKRMYFGIGGSVDGLERVCEERGVTAREVEDSGVVGMDQGVGRALVELTLTSQCVARRADICLVRQE